ncbi:MAG: transglutaminase family protein [Pseudomonadota bacterium]
MTIQVAVEHRTRYRYPRPIALGPQTIRLRPAPHTRQSMVSYSLDIQPAEHFLNWQQDPHGNWLARVVFPEKVSAFSIAVDLVVELTVFNPFDFFLEPDAETYPFRYDEELASDLEPYLATDPVGPRLQTWLDTVERKETRLVDFLVGLNHRVREDVDYVIRMEPGVLTPEETLRAGRGSCRDSAWLLVQLLRNLGIAARFVSGYLVQLKPDVPSLDGPSGTDADFTDLHAWAEAYLPGAGWVGFDATSGLLAGEGHVPLAATPQPTAAAPVTGRLEDVDVEFEFDMRVTRVRETPRVTKPYTEEAWAGIAALGDTIQARLDQDDVRLTIGGEPTFVGIDAPDADEWNTAALGHAKRDRAEDLIHRLRTRFAPGGLLHFGQGKWYPGEQLPRWALALYWRDDGEPLWRHDALLATPINTTASGTETDFARAFAQTLGIDSDAVVLAYEDPWHFLQQEANLPIGVEPEANELDDPMARERLARTFDRGLGQPVGAVLPVQRWNARDGARRWITERWRTRRGQLLLTPGDSPVGYRLPLPSLSPIAPAQYPHIHPLDPFAPRQSLPGRQQLRELLSDSRDVQSQRPQSLSDGAEGVRTAVAFEVRDGRLHIFLPPVETVEDYLELIAAAEEVAVAQGVPVVFEGYGPPPDPRIKVLRVTPDPGVIEVNVQPARSWTEMRTITKALYEEARLARLDTQKFMIDGRHTGTGGGNHVVLGGPSPSDSPFLRRPDLLRSLIVFWQQHPALSYLFSGLFIGPTSQAPRIDEARMDSVYELELAFNQIPTDAATVPPWLVDRVFRNLLVDATGNTHRTEICVDKLYSPDGPTGRLGLVEFRAFEMPPHAQMSLAQQALLLAIVSHLWRHPLTGPLTRWGTRLHDEFMLPHFIWQDFLSVIDALQQGGLSVDPSWFAPHFEFRFPRYGIIHHNDMELELRQGLEPWHVLGEEGAVGGTVRYVDSSLERVQIRVRDFNAQRYIVACNQRKVPMHATQRAGEYVGGVRYRAWQPSASLHPTIPVDTPLTVDIYDTLNTRAVAGCTYHVSHPGGRNYDTFPVNAFEAESRRLARFEAFGHTAGSIAEPTSTRRPEFPHTLDLRWT